MDVVEQAHPALAVLPTPESDKSCSVLSLYLRIAVANFVGNTLLLHPGIFEMVTQ